MIVYIDINHDVNSHEFQEFELKINSLGLQSLKSELWTRYNASGENSNIDVIVHSIKIKDDIKVNYEKHNNELSDHVGI